MSRTQEEIVDQIESIIETQIKPAVARHGGIINFKEFNDGELLLELSGACAGCAGSKMTLKMGVERIIKANVPEVEVVEAVDDENSGVDPYYDKGTVNVLNYKDV
jgi:Fe-S cluster biogenesis protein NfuA